MTTKTRPPIAAMERGPGPGAYSLNSTIGGRDSTKKKTPAFTMGARLGSSTVKKTDSPGPRYAIDSSISRKGKSSGPAYSMGGRPKEVTRHKGPAPGQYSPEKALNGRHKKGAAYSLGGRTRQRKTDNTPSPGTYSLPTAVGTRSQAFKNSGASFSMSGRPKKGGFAEDLAKTPGPGSYSQDVSATKKRAPGYSMLGRTFMPSDNTQKPGPGAHHPENCLKKKAPAYSMGVRHSDYTTPLIVDVPD